MTNGGSDAITAKRIDALARAIDKLASAVEQMVDQFEKLPVKSQFSTLDDWVKNNK